MNEGPQAASSNGDTMPKEPSLERPSPEDARSPRKTWRILFLDSPENVEQLKGACKEAGYVVVGAISIAEAWAFLDGKDHADVIVCAAHLEEESVFEFLKGVRENETHRHTSFLILSLHPGEAGARLDRSATRAGMLLGADGYLVMPSFDSLALIAHIEQVQPRVPMLQRDATSEEERRSE